MKKAMKNGLSLLALVAMFGMTGCKKGESSASIPVNSSGSNSPVHQSGFTYRGANVDDNAKETLYTGDKTAQISYTGNGAATYATSDATVLSVTATTGLLNPLKAGSATITATVGGKTALTLSFTVLESTVATGLQSYATSSFSEKAEILGHLEKYAVDNYLTGITLFSNGGYVLYNDRYVPTPSSYVLGYGWGTKREGKLKTDAAGNIVALPRSFGNGSTVSKGSATDRDESHFYTVATTALASHANALDGNGSDISDLADYLTLAYFGTRLTSDNSAYEWYPVLASDQNEKTDSGYRPIPLDDNYSPMGQENPNRNFTDKWRIYVKVGDQAPTYATGYSGEDRAQYDGRKVALEDYLTPLKYLLTGWNGEYRGPETTVGISGLKGTSRYLSETSKYDEKKLSTDYDSYGLWDNTLWKKYVEPYLHTGTDAKGSYIDFTLLSPCTQFYAMYYLSSTLFSPIPESFLGKWSGKGVDQYGRTPTTNNTPAETMIGVGPYYIAEFDSRDHIILARNKYYDNMTETLEDGTTRKIYQIPGFYFKKAEADQLENYFNNGQTDSYSPTKDKLSKYSAGTGDLSSKAGKWNRYQTKGDSNFKLNLNSTTAEEWDKYFGTNGSVYAHGKAETTTWTTERQKRFYLSDHDFLDFLSFGLDRPTITASRGMVATQEYFSDNYLIDPENGISYNSTAAHKAVLADRYNEHAGYDEQAAYDSLDRFLSKVDEDDSLKGRLEAKGGKATAGSKDNPYLIKIQMNWMNRTDLKDYSDVFDSWKRIFAKVCDENDHFYELVIDQPTPSSDFNEVYTTMEHGEFDIGFGAITGNALNPLNFFEVLKSDNSSGFTLNWGADTSKVSDEITYEGKKWSFDSLWSAADSIAVLNSQGNTAKATTVGTSKANDSDQSASTVIDLSEIVNAGATITSIDVTNAAGTATVTLPDDLSAVSNKVTVVVPNTLNSFTDEKEKESTLYSAKVQIHYNAVSGAVHSELVSTLTVPTYNGLH